MTLTEHETHIKARSSLLDALRSLRTASKHIQEAAGELEKSELQHIANQTRLASNAVMSQAAIVDVLRAQIPSGIGGKP